MKHILSFVSAVLMSSVLCLTPCYADEIAEDSAVEEDSSATTDSEKSESKFERVLLKKGSLISKEFTDYGTIETSWQPISLQTAKLVDIATGDEYYALRMEHDYYKSEYDNGTSTGVLDSDEIDGVISTLKYIKEHENEFKNYTEVNYTSSSDMIFGAYKSDDSSIFIKFDYKDTAYIEMSNIDDVIETFEGAQKALDDMK